MKHNYLTPFLNHLSLTMPSPVSDIAEINKKKETSLVIELVGGDKEADKELKKIERENKELAIIITNAIVAGLKQSKKYLEKPKDTYDEKIQVDKDKIKRITMTNGIDMNYGGGLLVFTSNFKIEKMIHMFYLQEKPKYFSISVEDTINEDVANEMMTNTKEYTSTDIALEIKKVLDLSTK